MGWISIAWVMTAAASLTLALVHLLVWLEQRDRLANLAFTAMATSVAAFAGFEVAMMHAATPDAWALHARWSHLAIWPFVVSLVVFTRHYLAAGRPWLAWSACGMRTLATAVNFWSPVNLNYREVTGLRHVTWLGEPLVAPVGAPNPWMLTAQLGMILLLAFLADATVTDWRRGHRRRALTVGGSATVFVAVAVTQTSAIFWGLIDLPVSVSVTYLLMLLAMGYELSRDMLRATRLAHALDESGRRDDLAATAVGLGFWQWDVARDEVWASPGARTLFAIPPHESLTMDRLLAAVHPDDREGAREALRHSLSNGGSFDTEYRVPLLDGTSRWVAARGRAEHGAADGTTLVRAVTMDATPRKHTEARLRDSEVIFRTVADAAPVLLWMCDADRRCVFLNKPWLDFTGRAREQQLGSGWMESVHPEDLPRYLEAFGAAFRAREKLLAECRLRRHDGAYRWIATQGVPLYDGGSAFAGYVGSCVDVTERRQADGRFRLAVEASPHAIVMVNAQGRIVLVNRHTERYFGYDRTELVGRSIEVLVPDRLRGAHPAARAAFMRDPAARDMGAGGELFAVRKDGTEMPVEVSLSPIHTDEGTFVLGTIVDISARRRSEVEIARLRDQLSHAGRVSTMGQLASALAHEINQPLGAILRNAEAAELLLAGDAPDLQELRAIVADIRKDDDRAGHVIDRLRAFLKRRDIDAHPLNVADLLDEVVLLTRADATARRIAVTCDPAPDLPSVHGDQIHLQQVVLNLVLNAMEAMRDAPAGDRILTLSAVPDASRGVEIAVVDRGHGIAGDKLDTVFEPFFTTKPDGMGMGLPISRTIVEAHGGRIWAERNPARGTTFRFTIPAVPASER